MNWIILAAVAPAVGVAVLFLRAQSARHRAFERIVTSLGLTFGEDRIRGHFRDVGILIERGAAPLGALLRATLCDAWPRDLAVRSSNLLDRTNRRLAVDRELAFPATYREHFEHPGLFNSALRFLTLGNTGIAARELRWELPGWGWPEEQLRGWLEDAATWATGLSQRYEIAAAAVEEHRRVWAAAAARLGLALVGDDRCSGCYRGMDLVLLKIDHDTRPRTRFTAPLGPDLPVGLQIRHERASDSLQRVLGHRDIEVGDVTVDRALRITSEDVPRAERLMRRKEIYQPMYELFEARPDAEVGGGELSFEIPGWRPSIPELEAALAPALAVVRAFQRFTDWPAKRGAWNEP